MEASNKSRGLTLVELLAVLVLLTLLAGVGLAGLAAASSQASIERVAVRWQELDRVARLTAIERRHARLPTLHTESGSMWLDLHDGRSRSIMFDDVGLAARFLIDGRHVQDILFDGRGCSPNYSVVITEVATARTRRWTVNGETGWIRFAEEEKSN